MLKRQLLTKKKLNINIRKNFVKCYTCDVKHGPPVDKSRQWRMDDVYEVDMEKIAES